MELVERLKIGCIPYISLVFRVVRKVKKHHVHTYDPTPERLGAKLLGEQSPPQRGQSKSSGRRVGSWSWLSPLRCCASRGQRSAFTRQFSPPPGQRLLGYGGTFAASSEAQHVPLRTGGRRAIDSSSKVLRSTSANQHGSSSASMCAWGKHSAGRELQRLPILHKYQTEDKNLPVDDTKIGTRNQDRFTQPRMDGVCM